MRSTKSFTTRINTEDKAPFLKVLHATNSHFRYVVIYKTYRQHDKSPIYKKKMAARTERYASRMETLVKPCKSDDKNAL